MIETGPSTVRLTNPPGTHDDIVTVVGVVVVDLTERGELGRGSVWVPRGIVPPRSTQTTRDALAMPGNALALRFAGSEPATAPAYWAVGPSLECPEHGDVGGELHTRAMIRISRPTLQRSGASSVVGCRVSIPGEVSQDLWVRVSGDTTTALADPFVALALLPAMKLGIPLFSEAPVSRTLLEIGIPAIQRIHQAWGTDKWSRDFPTFEPVDIVAQPIDEAVSGQGVGLFYSGGIDSNFSLMQFKDEITHLVFIADFEAPFSSEAHGAALAGVERVAFSLGKDVIQASTNAKEVFAPYVSWHHFHGPLLGSIALALQGQLASIHVPPSWSQDRLEPWGSHPDVDPLWSTRSLQVVHDETHATRFERTAVVAGNPLLLDQLRVCWRPEQNCGECPKCVRTRLTLQLLDRYTPGAPFNCMPLSPREVSRLDGRTGAERVHLSDMRDYLQRTGRHPNFLTAIDHALNGRYYTRLGSMYRGDLRARLNSRARRRAHSLLRATHTLAAARMLRDRLYLRRSS